MDCLSPWRLPPALSESSSLFSHISTLKSGHFTSWVSHLSACWPHWTRSHCPQSPCQSQLLQRCSVSGREGLSLSQIDSTACHIHLTQVTLVIQLPPPVLTNTSLRSPLDCTFLTNKTDVENSLGVLSVSLQFIHFFMNGWSVPGL